MRGRPLRRAALSVLLRSYGPCSIDQVAAVIKGWGYCIGGSSPGKALADALAYEHDRGWAKRVARGRYVVGNLSPSSRRRILVLFPGRLRTPP